MKKKTSIILFIFLFLTQVMIFTFTTSKSVSAIEKTSYVNSDQTSYCQQITNSKAISNSTVGQKYYESDRVVEALKIVISFVIPAFILFTGFSAKLSKFSKRLGKNSFLTSGIYGCIYTLISSLISFPLILYDSYFQSHIFGFSHGSLTSWLKNYSLDLLLTMIGILFLLWVPFKLIKKHPKKWWIYTGILTIPVTLFMYLAQPVIIDPLFDNFKPIENKAVEKSLLDLTQKANIDNCTILQIYKSSETNMINAYMTGIGNSKRIVLWDTAINNLSLNELKFVMAHEIGHYALGHIKKLVIIDIISTFIVLYIVNILSQAIIKKHAKRLKFNKLSNVAAYPLAILIINFCFLFITPSMNTYSCYTERQADKFALELTQDNKSAISAFDKLSKNGVVIPNADFLYKLWQYDHPTIDERIEFFRNYIPSKQNKN